MPLKLSFHFSLPVYLSDQIERVQRRVLRIMHPEASHRKAQEDTNLTTLIDRLEELCVTLITQRE